MEKQIELKQENVIKCHACNVKLAEIIITSDKQNQEHKMKFKPQNCYNCGAEGFFSKTFKGRGFINKPNHNIHLTVVDTFVDKDDVICGVFSTRRKK